MPESANNSPIGERSSSQTEAGSLRRSLWFVTIAWGVFGSTWFFATTGAPLTRYCKLLGFPEIGFGLLAALPFLATLMQLPASYMVERFGHLKPVLICAGLVHRALWMVVALVPWVLPKELWIAGMLLVVFLSAAVNHIAAPLWFVWMVDLVPASIRGRYFSRRALFAQFAGVVVTLGVSSALDMAGGVNERTLMIAISSIFALAGIVGMLDFVCFLPVPPPQQHKPNPQLKLREMLGPPLRDRNFLRFLGFTATMTFGLGYVGQFVWLYMFDVVGMTNVEANWMLVIIPLIVGMASVLIWGRLIDRFGRKPVLIIGTLLIVLGGPAWVLVTRETWIVGYAVVLVSTFAWPGIDLANFNMLLGMSESLSGRRYSMAYIVIWNAVVAVSGFLSGLFGGVIAEVIGNWTGTVLGCPLTYHGVLFLISGTLRLVSIAWLIGLVDQRAAGTRETLRYMAVTVHSNLQQAVTTPFRMAARAGMWTFKLYPKKRLPPRKGGQPGA